MDMSKFCSQCGAAISETAKFCPSCGAVIDSVASSQNTSMHSENSSTSESIHETATTPKYEVAQTGSIDGNGYIKDKGIKELFFKKKGRLNRKRYILRCLTLSLIFFIALLLITTNVQGLMITGNLLFIGTLIPYIMLSIRRCHDLNHSGYFFLLCAIPIGNVIIPLMLWLKKGTSGPNNYGPDPLGTIMQINRDSYKSPGSEIKKATKKTGICPFCQAVVPVKTKNCPLCQRNIKGMI